MCLSYLPHAELDIFKNNGFLSDDQIRDEVLRFKKLYPPGHKFLLKVCGRLATDMKMLNAKAQLVAGFLPAQYVCMFSLEGIAHRISHRYYWRCLLSDYT